MANFISEQVIRQIAEKYVRSIKSNPVKTPDIRKIVTEAIRVITPTKKITQEDVSAVMKELSGRPVINDQVIAEVAKKMADNSAQEDLVFAIKTYAKQLKLKLTDKDINGIIQFGKLDPYRSTPFQIKNATRDYFQGGRPVEAIPRQEIRDVIKTEMSKDGPVDDRDVTIVLQKYLAKADQKKPLQTDDIKAVVDEYVANKPAQPQPEPAETPAASNQTPVDRAETPSAEPKPPKGPTPPPPRQGRATPPIEPGDPVPPKDRKKPNFFEQIRMKMARYGIVSLTRYARNWLTDNVNKAAKTPTRKKILTQGTTVQEAFIGKMFLYFYDAKLKEQLPYWDKFPLIVCVDLAEDGWYGLNLHYLPFPMRVKLFDDLLTIADDKRLDKIERLKISYGLLRGFVQFPEAKPCFKRYLTTHVKSELLEIEPIDWEIAIFLPLQKFQKAPQEKVWSDSKRMIQQLKRRR